MPKGTFIYNGEGIAGLVDFLEKSYLEFGKSGKVKIEVKDAETRSNDQNSLYFQWMGVMAREFTKKGRAVSKDQMHELMKYKFLGTEYVRVGNTDLPDRLKSTTKLNKGEMSEYMNKVEAWALDCGVQLPMPEDNDYMAYREARQ